jgi:protein tyrosine/serine phosphatase
MRVLTLMHRYRFISSQAVLAIVGSLLIGGVVSAKSNNSFSNVQIKNFGQLDERFYRGAQPKERDYQALADLGIKTIIDLRDDPVRYEKSAAEALGMHYINIPMSDTRYPGETQIAEFLKTVNDPATGKFFVHCAGGRHRTGVMGAVYRYNYYGWDYDKVYQEMKSYDFYTSWGHGAMKDYVVDYWQKIQQGKIHTIASVAAH